jgi:hypothetical protein
VPVFLVDLAIITIRSLSFPIDVRVRAAVVTLGRSFVT